MEGIVLSFVLLKIVLIINFNLSIFVGINFTKLNLVCTCLLAVVSQNFILIRIIHYLTCLKL